jgi:hypothetical protein
MYGAWSGVEGRGSWGKGEEREEGRRKRNWNALVACNMIGLCGTLILAINMYVIIIAREAR